VAHSSGYRWDRSRCPVRRRFAVEHRTRVRGAHPPALPKMGIGYCVLGWCG